MGLSSVSRPQLASVVKGFTTLVTCALLWSCGVSTLNATTSSGNNGLSAGPEPANCTPIGPVTNPIVVSGNAVYYYRQTSATIGLTGDPVSANIRYAEVAIYNSGGTLVQCGHTDGSGAYSLSITKTPGNYTVKVFSRSYTGAAEVNASVLEDIYASAPYSVSTVFTVSSGSSSITASTLTAYARVSESAKIEGGAFFIFDNILYANERIRTLISDSSFVAPKVQAYWKMGFNPYSYFGSPSSLASFYVNGDRKLYILGGYNGDVKSSDTDHFDASVIVHEYSHFLEDVYGRSESPGGSHNGNAIIDPRLAWSEGWANYLQAQLLFGRYVASSLYVDTIGFKNDSVEGSYGGTGVGIKFDLSTDGATSLYDAVGTAGEGTFREVSISRTLFKTTKSPASNTAGAKGSAIPFLAIWNTFKSNVSGFGTSSSTVFRSIGYFNEYLYSYINTNYAGSLSNWVSYVLADEQQNTSRVDFSDPVTNTGVCAKYPRVLTPVREAYDAYGVSRSNLLRASDFYTFTYTGSGSQVINLTYTQSGAQTIDLDLIVLRSDFRLIEDDQEFGSGVSNPYYSVRSRRLNPSVESGSESVSLSGLSAGTYLIQVKAVTYNRSTATPLTTAQVNGTANYTLQLVTNGSTTEYLCPAH